MIRVNLVPSELLAKARERRRLRQFGAVGAAFLVLIVGATLLFALRLEHYESRLSSDNNALKALAEKVAKVEEIRKESGDLRARLKVITDLMRTRPVYPVFMSDFVRSVPAVVQITNLSTTGESGTAAPITISVTGQSLNNDGIAAWINAMENSGKFSNLQLGPVTISEGETTFYAFSITGVYKPAF